MFHFVKFRIPLYYTVILCGVITAITYIFFKNSSSPEEVNATDNSITTAPAQQFDVKRLFGYNYIRPLMFVETNNKSDRYAPLLQKITAYIEAKKQVQELTAASFYFRDMENTAWTGYNEDEKYNPGSLMKVPELISVLRLEERKPGTLDKQLFYTTPFITEKRTRFLSKQLQPGKNYSIKELLRYMIAYSDNNATLLLDQNLDQNIFNNTLSDVGLPLPQKILLITLSAPKDFHCLCGLYTMPLILLFLIQNMLQSC